MGNINIGNILTIGSLFYIILLMVVYFSKARVKNEENRIYSSLLKCNFFGLISAIACYFSVLHYEELGIINYIVSRLYLLYLVAFIFFFFTYLLVVVSKNNKDTFVKCKKYFTISFVVIAIVIYYLPLYYENKAGVYSYGPSANIVYAFATICMVGWTIILLRSRNRTTLKKLVPIAIFILGAMLTTIIQKTNPALLIMTSMESFVVFLMYFTIENPDISMLNELYKNKELMEQNYEDKYNFLFEMTQEARNPLININNLSNALRMEDDKEKIKEGLLSMSNLVRQLDFSINDILNISSLDVQRIKVVNNKYELEKLCNDLDIRIKPELKPGVKFQITMPRQLPILYGDYIKIRQILYSLLVNACKNTVQGNINMHVNLIEKYDVCRLIFNISDTGSGMPIEKINDILSSTGSLDKQEIDNLEKKEYNVKMCQKIVKIMGGNLMIKSNHGEGTDVILTIDQKVFHEKDKSILNQYENSIASYKKVLIVSQNKDKLNTIKKKLTDNKITYSSLYYGADAIDRIKSGKKFDFILVDDEMLEMSGFMTFKGMRDISGFNIPVIIMLKKDKEHIKEHYLSDGFSDYLLLDNLETELDRIIEKY